MIVYTQTENGQLSPEVQVSNMDEPNKSDASARLIVVFKGRNTSWNPVNSRAGICSLPNRFQKNQPILSTSIALGPFPPGFSST